MTEKELHTLEEAVRHAMVDYFGAEQNRPEIMEQLEYYRECLKRRYDKNNNANAE